MLSVESPRAESPPA